MKSIRIIITITGIKKLTADSYLLILFHILEGFFIINIEKNIDLPVILSVGEL